MGACGCADGTDFLISSKKVLSLKFVFPCDCCNERTVTLGVLQISRADAQEERELGTPDMSFEHFINGIEILDLKRTKELFLAEFEPWFRVDAPKLDKHEMEWIFDDWLAGVISRSIADTLSKSLARLVKNETID